METLKHSPSSHRVHVGDLCLPSRSSQGRAVLAGAPWPHCRIKYFGQCPSHDPACRRPPAPRPSAMPQPTGWKLVCEAHSAGRSHDTHHHARPPCSPDVRRGRGPEPRGRGLPGRGDLALSHARPSLPTSALPPTSPLPTDAPGDGASVFRKDTRPPFRRRFSWQFSPNWRKMTRLCHYSN